MVTIRRHAVIRALLVTTAILGLASVAVQVSRHGFDHGHLFGLTAMFDMRGEGNLPAWFSTVVLLACGAFVGLIWVAATRRREAFAPAWAALAVLFAAASADEAASIHETIGSELSGGGATYPYLIPGALLLAGIGYALRPFFAQLPQATRRPLVWGIGAWVFGAVALEVIEMFLGPGFNEPRELAPDLLNTVQDIVELLGLIIILHALAFHSSQREYRVTLRVADS